MEPTFGRKLSMADCATIIGSVVNGLAELADLKDVRMALAVLVQSDAMWNELMPRMREAVLPPAAKVVAEGEELLKADGKKIQAAMEAEAMWPKEKDKKGS